jgi:hypothetical protein
MQGAQPRGASVTSGAVSAFEALAAGDVTINTVAMPALASGVSAAGRVTQLVDAINSLKRVTGVVAVKVTSTTFKLTASVDIVVATLAGAATLSNTGLTAGTTAKTLVLLLTRAAFGKNVSGSDHDIIKLGGQEINVKHAKAMGLLDQIGTTTIEYTPPAAPTRVDA